MGLIVILFSAIICGAAGIVKASILDYYNSFLLISLSFVLSVLFVLILSWEIQDYMSRLENGEKE